MKGSYNVLNCHQPWSLGNLFLANNVILHCNTVYDYLVIAALLSSATANGFQIVVNGAQSKALPDFSVTNLQGRLSGHGIEEQLPTIVISAYYDATGIAPVC